MKRQISRMREALEDRVFDSLGWIAQRFQKRRTLPVVAKVELAPTANRIQFYQDGRLMADMTLVKITWHHKRETEVFFRETGPFLKERTIHRPSMMTVAEYERRQGA